MAYTRDWSAAIPIDHTQIKLGPEKIRDVRTDLDERLSAILGGFTAGETVNGIKIGRLLTVGTATATNPGTGTAAAIDIIGLTSGSMTEVVIRNSSGGACLLTYQGRLQVGKLGNDQYMIAVGTGSGDVNVFKINTAGVTEFASFPILPNTGVTTNLQVVPYGALRNIFDSACFSVTTAAAAVSASLSGAFGTWVDVTTGAAVGAAPTATQAATDGFIVAFGPSSSTGSYAGYTDASTGPSTLRAGFATTATNQLASFMMPVKKGDYWKVVVVSGSAMESVYWLPLGK